ncbi:MAG: hypothetical protein WD749_14660 [Phycisphaerales bacterium]
MRVLAAMGLATLFSAAPAALLVSAGTLALPAPVMAQDATQDTLILRSGRVVSGRILEETASSVKMEINVSGIVGVTEFPRTDILEITRAAKADAPKADAPKPDAKAAAAKPPVASDGKAKVYIIELTGWFGEDISETPIRNALADAKKHNPDFIIFTIDNDWSLRRFGQLDDIKDDQGQFDQLFRAEDMEPIFNSEIPTWDKPPKVVFWVKKAMGGACFLPFLCRDIYFHAEGKMGGIGKLEQMFGSMGDKVVQEKQFSLRLGHAEGKAIQSGYDPIIVRAMARTEQILSVKFEGGKPVLLERMPDSADEQLLTDDGEGIYADTIEQLARSEGNDCLTLTADIAYKLGVSRGTVDSMDDLLHQLGLSRTSEIVKGQSPRVMQAWRDGLESAKRQLPKLWRQYNEVEVKDPGGYRERTEARGRRKTILNQMQQLEKRYEEALNPNQIRVPNYDQIDEIKKIIELEQLADRPERR